MRRTNDGGPVREIIGVIREVDSSGREMTVTVQGALKAFSVPTACSILLHGEPVKLRMLQPGDYARVAYCRGGEALEARSIQVNWWLPLHKGAWALREGGTGDDLDQDEPEGEGREDGLPARDPGVLIADSID